MGAACCTVCKKMFGWIPVLFITTIIVWSYYAYVVELCFFTVENIAEKVFYLLLYHIILMLFLWTYWRTIFQEHAPVPSEFFLNMGEQEAFLRSTTDDERKEALHDKASRLPIATYTQAGGFRYCEKCCCLKPDRAHHCSMCEKCILKMDHHCPWVNNCVGYSTYKFFILFLAYAELYCVFIVITALQYFIDFWKQGGLFSGNRGKFHILFVFFVAFMFAVSLTALLGYHIFLLIKNRSTLESFRAPILRSGPDKNAFNLGRSQNFREVFGDSPYKWFLPIFSSRGDGAEFVLNFASQQSASTYSAVTFTRNNGFSEDQSTIEEDVKPILNREVPPDISRASNT